MLRVEPEEPADESEVRFDGVHRHGDPDPGVHVRRPRPTVEGRRRIIVDMDGFNLLRAGRHLREGQRGCDYPIRVRKWPPNREDHIVGRPILPVGPPRLDAGGSGRLAERSLLDGLRAVWQSVRAEWHRGVQVHF